MTRIRRHSARWYAALLTLCPVAFAVGVVIGYYVYEYFANF